MISEVSTVEELISKPNPDICEDMYGTSDTHPNNYIMDEIMVLLYRILDGKHDFEGGNKDVEDGEKTDRSFMSDRDCNESILKYQIQTVLGNRIDINDCKFCKYLIRDDSKPILLKEAKATSKANTIHPVFDFTSGFEKFPYILGDKIRITLETKEGVLKSSYCVDRPFYKEYQLITLQSKGFLKKNQPSTIDTKIQDELKSDIAEYGEHAIYNVKVGKKEDFKRNTTLHDKLRSSDFFDFESKQYTIDATHITKDVLLEQSLFGNKSKIKPSDSFYGDYMDPASVSNGTIFSNQPKKFTNRFHYCFIRGKKLEMELKPHDRTPEKINIIFHYDGESDNFEYPPGKISETNGLAPSVSDISLFVVDEVLKKKNSFMHSILSSLGKVSDILKKNRKVPQERALYFGAFFRDVFLATINNVVASGQTPLSNEEITVILCTLKTVGDQIRLIDAQNLTLQDGVDAFCVTLDKFLFDFGVASRKSFLLGDTASKNNFELIVYMRRPAVSEDALNDRFKQFGEYIVSQFPSDPPEDVSELLGDLLNTTLGRVERLKIEGKIKQKMMDIQYDNERERLNAEIETILTEMNENGFFSITKEHNEILKQTIENYKENVLAYKNANRKNDIKNFELEIKGVLQEDKLCTQKEIIQMIKFQHLMCYIVVYAEVCLRLGNIENDSIREILDIYQDSFGEYRYNMHNMPEMEMKAILKRLRKLYGNITKIGDAKLKKVKSYVENSIVEKADDVLYYMSGCMTTKVNILHDISLPPLPFEEMRGGAKRDREEEGEEESQPKEKKRRGDKISELSEALKYLICRYKYTEKRDEFFDDFGPDIEIFMEVLHTFVSSENENYDVNAVVSMIEMIGESSGEYIKDDIEDFMKALENYIKDKAIIVGEPPSVPMQGISTSPSYHHLKTPLTEEQKKQQSENILNAFLKTYSPNQPVGPYSKDAKPIKREGTPEKYKIAQQELYQNRLTQKRTQSPMIIAGKKSKRKTKKKLGNLRFPKTLPLCLE